MKKIVVTAVTELNVRRALEQVIDQLAVVSKGLETVSYRLNMSLKEIENLSERLDNVEEGGGCWAVLI